MTSGSRVRLRHRACVGRTHPRIRSTKGAWRAIDRRAQHDPDCHSTAACPSTCAGTATPVEDDVHRQRDCPGGRRLDCAAGAREPFRAATSSDRHGERADRRTPGDARTEGYSGTRQAPARRRGRDSRPGPVARGTRGGAARRARRGAGCGNRGAGRADRAGQARCRVHGEKQRRCDCGGRSRRQRRACPRHSRGRRPYECASGPRPRDGAVSRQRDLRTRARPVRAQSARQRGRRRGGREGAGARRGGPGAGQGVDGHHRPQTPAAQRAATAPSGSRGSARRTRRHAQRAVHRRSRGWDNHVASGRSR